MKNFIFLLISALLFLQNIYSAKLDILADLDSSFKSFSNLIDKDKNYNLNYFTQTSELVFTLKNINLEKTENSWMDLQIGFFSTSIQSSSKTINSLYINDLYNFYDRKNSVFIPNKAFIKIHNFLKDNIILSFGKQSYTLSSGMVISDNRKGLNGIKIELLNQFYSDTIELFYFRPENYLFEEKPSDNLFGASFYKSFGDGMWQIYFVKEKNDELSKEIFFESKKTNKVFYGISYNLNQNNITYFSDFVLQKGYSINISNKKIKHNAYALNLKALWNMKLPKLGKVDAKFNFIKSSGNSSNSFSENRAFYSPYSLRFNGFERVGAGEIYKAGFFDTHKTTSTLTGINDDLSGFNIYGFGIDIPQKENKISFDYFAYKATNSITKNKSVFLANEYNIKYTINLSKKASFSIIYCSFSPKSTLNPNNLKTTKLFSISIKTGF